MISGSFIPAAIFDFAGFNLHISGAAFKRFIRSYTFNHFY